MDLLMDFKIIPRAPESLKILEMYILDHFCLGPLKNVIVTDVFAHVLPPKAEIPLFSLCFCNAENVQKPL